MTGDVKRYVNNCHVCRRSKAFRNAYAGGFQQLRVPDRPWKDIAVNFVVGLPPAPLENMEVTNIMTVTCRLTKLRHYIATDSIDAIDTSLSITGFLTRLCEIEERSSSQSFGNVYVSDLGLGVNYRQPFIPKQIVNPKIRIKSWNSISARSPTTYRVTGQIGYQLRNSLPTTMLRRLLRLHPST